MGDALVLSVIAASIFGIYLIHADPYGWQNEPPCHETAAVLRVGSAPLECHHKARFEVSPLGAETLARCVCPAPAAVTP